MIGPVLRDEDRGVDPEVLEDLVLDSLDPHSLFGSSDLVAVHAVLEQVKFSAQLANATAHNNEGRISLLRDPLDLEPGPTGICYRGLDPGQRHP